MTALSDLLNDARGDRNVDRLIEDAEQRGHKIDRGTIYRALAGDHGKRPREKTLAAFAEVFGLDIRKVREAADRPAGEREPWVPTPESAQLNREQRMALDRLIKVIVQTGGQAHGNATPTNDPTPLKPRRDQKELEEAALVAAQVVERARKPAARTGKSRAKAQAAEQDAAAQAPQEPDSETGA